MTSPTLYSHISPAEAATELLKRRQAKKSLASFIDYLGLGFKPASHHKLLIEHLEAVERGDIHKLMVWMPPGSAKSTYTSILFPPWFMGRNPKKPVLGVSNTTELAERFSRRARNLVSSHLYRNVFGFGCSEDTKSAGNWENERGGEFFAAGIGSAIAGRRAGLGLIDDPVKSREEADSERIRQKHWDWYLNDFLTRLLPKAPQICIQCMTGDTSVLMADGASKQLKTVSIGDEIATYKDGRLSSSKVLNWANQGPDYIYSIRMKSGIIVRANERHPFLVHRDGKQEWIRLRNLRVGDLVVRAIGESGAESVVPSRVVAARPEQGAFATRTTTKLDGRVGIVRRQLMRSLAELPIFVTAIGLISKSMKLCSKSREASALFANNLLAPMLGLTGVESFASIMTMSPGRLADCYATTAISLSVTQRQKTSLSRPLDTYTITHDAIAEIAEAGREDVFDIQVADTENFIANGLVSHNTRWHEDDLGGRILAREADQWTVLKLPMEAVGNDPLGRNVGDRLWPEWFTDEMIATAKMDTRAWNALYQQDPAPEDGEYFKREMFNEYDVVPHKLHIYAASDYAVSEGSGDFTEHGIFGIDFNGDLYVLDWWREQAASNVWIEKQCDLIARYQPLIWFGEAGPIRKAIEPFLKRRMTERQAFCRLEWLPSIHDKVVRARPFQARASMGNVYIPAHAPWLPDLMSQLMRFPAGKYDDGVDVCSLIGRGLEFVRGPTFKPEQPVSNGYQSHRNDNLGWMGQ